MLNTKDILETISKIVPIITTRSIVKIDGKELHFLSIKEAGETLNIPSASISAVLRNQQYQTRGYIFKYK